jgi:hypothetical protein
MTDEMCKKDIRGLLKSFGVMADEAIVGHIATNPDVKELNLRVVLEDLTEYKNSDIDRLSLEVTKSIHCK